MDAAASAEAICQPHLVKKVIACFVNHVFALGPIYAFSVFLPVMKADFDVALPEASAITSTLTTAQFAGSLFAGLLIPQKMGHASVALFGAVAVLIGLGVLSVVKNVFAAYPAVLLAGLGMGASNLAGLVALNATVPAKKRATMVGLASCGTSIGTILQPLFYTSMTEALGWRWAMRINAATTCFFLAIAAPFFHVEAKPESTSGPQLEFGARPKHRLRDPRFICWWLNMFVCFFGYYFPTTVLAEFADKELHVPGTVAATCYSVIGVTALTTRLCLGFLTHRCGGSRRLFFVSQFLVGVFACFMPFCWNAKSLLVWSAIYGSSIGPVIALVSVVLSELFGTKDLALYHGVSRTGVGAGNLLGVPVLSVVVETWGYAVAVILAGALVSSSTLFLLILEVFERRKRRAEAVEGSTPMVPEHQVSAQ